MGWGVAVLASGSRGNATLARLDDAGLLLDVGLGPRTLGRRLAATGVDEGAIHAAVITHTHGDHARDATLRWMATRRIPLFCHERHPEALGARPGFGELVRRGLVRTFDDRPFLAAPGVWVEPFALRHSGPTFGYRVEGRSARRGRSASLGYLTDTGSWTDPVLDALADVDWLGIEFNHDVAMERASGRSPYLIARNLGDWGHLSNDQGAALLGGVLDRSRPEAVRQVVLLHLSDECNRPPLALRTAREALRRRDRRASVRAARQDAPMPPAPVRPARRRRAIVAGFPWES